MKRHIALALALTLGALTLSLAGDGPSAEAAGRRQHGWTTGLVKVSAGESLRLRVVNGPKAVSFNYSKIEYAAAGDCEDSVCRHAASSQSASETITLAPFESWSLGASNPTSLSAVAYTVSSGTGGLAVFADRVDAATGVYLGAFEVGVLG